MDVSLIMAVVGIVFTVVFGVMATPWIAHKRMQGHVTFFITDIQKIINNVAQGNDDLNVLYKGKPVKKNLIYVKGAFVNIGLRDISGKPSNDHAIKISLPTDFKRREDTCNRRFQQAI